jgi:hypothetical protein
MKTFALVLLLVSVTTFASAAKKTFTAAEMKTVYVQGNSKTANDIRRQMGKDSAKGRICIIPTNDPNAADLRMQVDEQRRDQVFHAPNLGNVLIGSQSPTAITITDRAGVDVFNGDSQMSWERVYVRILQQLCQ